MIDYEPKSWVRICFSMRGSVAPRLLPRVAIAGALGWAAQWLDREEGVWIPPLAHTLIGLALGLLLVFRTNASYGRYVEARTLLGRMLDASRDLARQLVTLVPDHPGWAARRRDVLRWTGAFYRLAAQSVRDESDLGRLGERLTAAECETLEPVGQRASVVATWISADVAVLMERGLIDGNKLLAMDANLTALVQALGGCQRIRRTPVPFAYAQHIKIFVLLFCYTVPFALSESLHEYTWIAVAALAFALFGIDEIGVEIEDPFGYDPNDLPLEAIGDTIDASLRDIEAAGAHSRGGPIAT
jgi:ion channel-forming bestrophin family protein